MPSRRQLATLFCRLTNRYYMRNGYSETSLLIAKTVLRSPPRSPQTCFSMPIYTVYSVRPFTTLKVHTRQRGLAFSDEVINCTTFTPMTSDPSSQAYLGYMSSTLPIHKGCLRGKNDLCTRRVRLAISVAHSGHGGLLKPWAIFVTRQVAKVLKPAI